jgi:hypothetical protein
MGVRPAYMVVLCTFALNFVCCCSYAAAEGECCLSHTHQANFSFMSAFQASILFSIYPGLAAWAMLYRSFGPNKKKFGYYHFYFRQFLKFSCGLKDIIAGPKDRYNVAQAARPGREAIKY